MTCRCVPVQTLVNVRFVPKADSCGAAKAAYLLTSSATASSVGEISSAPREEVAQEAFFATVARPACKLEDIGQLLSVSIAHNESGLLRQTRAAGRCEGDSIDCH
jgi:hypothetical protein